MTNEQKQEIFNAGFRAWQIVGNITHAMETKAHDLEIEVTDQELGDIEIDLAIHIQNLKRD